MGNVDKILGGSCSMIVTLATSKDFLDAANKLLIIQSWLPARRYASAGLCYSDVSVCPSVCHTPVLCLAERKQDREMYTVW